MIFEQYAHQAEEWKFRAERARAYLWQMRTGKTKMAIDQACHLFLSMEIRGVLVIAPNGIHRQWVESELPKHVWSGISPHEFAWRFSNPKNAEEFKAWSQFLGAGEMHWLAVNMEALIRPEVQKAVGLFLKHCSPAMAVFDESHHFAKPGAKRTAVARGLARRAAYARILTGTESENSPLQSFSQYELLKRGALGHETYGSFKARYAVYEQMQIGGRRFPKLSGYQNLEELKARKAPYSSVVLRSDCEDLPPVQIERRAVELMPKQAKLWRDVKAKEIEALERLGQASAPSGGAALVKLQQIEGGFWKHADGRIEDLCKGFQNNPKMLILLDEITQHDGQVVAWFQFIHELEAAWKMLGDAGIGAGGFHGKMGMQDRERWLSRFQKGESRILLCQPMAGGEGRSMPASLMLWYSATPDAAVRSQAAERATVLGGASVQMVDFAAPGGVDEYFLKLTARKTALAADMSREGLKILQNLNI